MENVEKEGGMNIGFEKEGSDGIKTAVLES